MTARSHAQGSENTGDSDCQTLTIGSASIRIGSADRSAWKEVRTLISPRNRYQEGSLRKVRRRSGAEVWEYRFRNHAEPGSPMRQITLSVLEYPTTSKARLRLHEEVLRINGAETYRAHNEATMGVVIDRFSTEERLEDIVKQKP